MPNVPTFVIPAQLAVSTVVFLMFFRLQQIGGPTYLSQIGYVAAAVGVVERTRTIQIIKYYGPRTSGEM